MSEGRLRTRRRRVSFGAPRPEDGRATNRQSSEDRPSFGTPLVAIPDETIATFVNSPRFIDVLRQRWGHRIGPKVVDEMPRDAQENDEIHFWTGYNEVIWTLSYQPSRANDPAKPWIPVGQVELVTFSAGPKTVNWTSWGGGPSGPNIDSVPAFGDYWVVNGCTQHGGGGAGLYMQAQVAGETLVDTSAAVSFNEEQSSYTTRLHVGVGRGAAILSQYRMTAGSMVAHNTFTKIKPIRLGRNP